MKEIYIIGGGPAGMMAAIAAKEHHPTWAVTIIEQNTELGVKLRLTGGGRCNVTAAVGHQEMINNIVKNGKFLYSALQQFDAAAIQTFFEDNHCPLKIEDHQRVFPKSDKAKDILLTLQQKLDSLHIHVLFNTKVIAIDYAKCELKTAIETLRYDHLILATGGKSYPQTGSDGSGYMLAQAGGHTITDLLPAEVPLVSNDQVIQTKLLQGLSFNDVEIHIYHKQKVKWKIRHDLLFTHFGISGPAALRASYYVLKILAKEPSAQITIDFLPSITSTQLDHDIQHLEKQVFLTTYSIPKRLYQYLESTCVKDTEIAYKLKRFPLSIYTTRGFSNAFVTNGGISVKEIIPSTMQSKIVENVSFCGEVMDVNAFTGGFNISVAFISGYVAGRNIPIG